MTIRALFFAHLQGIAGAGEKIYQLADGSTISQFADHLAESDIRFNGILRYARTAVNGEWANATTVLNDGDEIGFLPPSSGG